MKMLTIVSSVLVFVGVTLLLLPSKAEATPTAPATTPRGTEPTPPLRPEERVAPEPVAQFAVGDLVTVEGIELAGFPVVGVVVEVGPIMEWTNTTTNEDLMSRGYLVEFDFEGVKERLAAPEIALKKVQ